MIIISRSSIVSHLPIAASITIYSIKNVAINLEDYVNNHKIQVYENITSEDIEKITSISCKLVI